MHDNNEHIDLLIFKYIKGELSEDEYLELKKWKDTSSENKEHFAKLVAIYRSHNKQALLNNYDSTIAWNSLKENYIPSRSVRLRKFIRYAASITIILSASLLTYYYFDANQTHEISDLDEYISPGGRKATLITAEGNKINLAELKDTTLSSNGIKFKNEKKTLKYSEQKIENKKTEYHTIYVPRAGEYSLILADGTKVYLNSDSKLKYPISFDGDTRTVELEGEGYFAVKHNEKQPFIVKCKDSEVKVLGTRFNINSYAQKITTTLVEGKVQFSTGSKQVILKPNQQTIKLDGSDNIEIKEIDASIYTSWIAGIFEFNNTELNEVKAQLERWYNIKINFEETNNLDLGKLKITGVVKKDKPISFVLDLVAKLIDIEYKIKGNEITISVKK